MPTDEATPYACPTCGAEYKVVRVEAKTMVPEGRLTCTKCGGPLHAARAATSSNPSWSAGRDGIPCGRGAEGRRISARIRLNTAAASTVRQLMVAIRRASFTPDCGGKGRRLSSAAGIRCLPSYRSVEGLLVCQLGPKLALGGPESQRM